MSFEQALSLARGEGVSPPSFATALPALLDAREKQSAAVERTRAQVQRWLWLCAGGFLLLPVDQVLFAMEAGFKPQVTGVAAAAVVPAMLLAWGARLVRRPSFGAQMLTRAILASNLVVACILAMSGGGLVAAVVQVLVGLGCGAGLWKLWGQGLMGHEAQRAGEGSSFAPVRFRGFLVVALVMAFADAQTLAFAAGSQALEGGLQVTRALDDVPYTGGAALLMALNVWGLYRLRTWAMLLNIVANIAIAVAALGGSLGVNLYVAAALSLTAVVQLLLPVPILATALGDSRAGQGLWKYGAAFLRAGVVLITVLTIVAGIMNTGGYEEGRRFSWAPERGVSERGIGSQVP